MAKIIFVSNLLPVAALKKENGDYDLQMRIGGIASGLRKFYADNDSIWVGWDGIEKGSYGPEEKIKIEKLFRSRNCQPVQLKKK